MGKVRELECRSIDIFHYLVMNFLSIVQRGRPYCAMDILYLFTIMNQLDI